MSLDVISIFSLRNREPLPCFDSRSSCPNCSQLITCISLSPPAMEVILTGAPLTRLSYHPHTRQIPQMKRSCCTLLPISSSSTLTSALTASRSSYTRSTSVAWRYGLMWGWATAWGPLGFCSDECWGKTAALPALPPGQREWEPACCVHSTLSRRTAPRERRGYPNPQVRCTMHMVVVPCQLQAARSPAE